MTARGHFRGNAGYWDEADQVWRYADGSLPSQVGARPCPACGMCAPLAEPDPCLGYIEGLTSACCGHGLEEPYCVPKAIPLTGADSRA